jgi:hypothetical protein
MVEQDASELQIDILVIPCSIKLAIGGKHCLHSSCVYRMVELSKRRLCGNENRECNQRRFHETMLRRGSKTANFDKSRARHPPQSIVSVVVPTDSPRIAAWRNRC